MKATEFCYWLQGYLEITFTRKKHLTLTTEQVKVIQKHLNMIFLHDIDKQYPLEEQEKLNHLHNNTITNSNKVMRC